MTAPPRATYRLQLTPDFDFARAAALVPYLGGLGVSHVYCSPIFEAPPASTHGYDVTDPTRVRAALGGEAGFRALADSARGSGLGIVLDIVPNHMAAAAENPWWWDVMKRGERSAAARLFDIDWRRGGGKLVLPVLGRPLAEVLDAGELSVARGSPHDPGERVLRYHDRVFPLAGAAPGNAVEALLEAQAYRLVYWKSAADAPNYRRFFDVTDLVGVRVEDVAVFELTHGLVLRLVREGLVDGLRLDHVDGLRDPAGYLERLRAAVGPETWLLVEKILGPDETLPADWPVDGTTGYEILGRLNALFVDPAGLARLAADAQRAHGMTDFPAIAREAKRDVFGALFGSELSTLAALLAEAAGAAAPPAEALEAAIVETTVGLGVYRTYLRRGRASAQDDARLRRALGRARDRLGGDHDGLRLLQRVLLREHPPGAEASAWAFIERWQQISGPVMAKGVEDTALYRHVVLVSMNDVGAEPVLPADPVRAFHDFCAARAAERPRALNATATHDTKRGEDTRLRIDALSETAGAWLELVKRARSWHAPLRRQLAGGPAPSPADELLLYQTLAGIWPADEAPLEPIAARLGAFMIKAAREAKLRTSWREPDADYESALDAFSRALVLGPEGVRFRRAAAPLLERCARLGAVSSLAQTLLKITVPGVPDLYQGTESWDLSLVDPDNRRAVDFDRSAAALSAVTGRADHEAMAAELPAHWPDGRIKLLVTRRALEARARQPELFARGGYVPLACRGRRGARLVAFGRELDGAWCVVIVPRLLGSVPAPVWGDTAVDLPPRAPRRWRDRLTGAPIDAADGRVEAAAVFRRFPVALLEPSA